MISATVSLRGQMAPALTERLGAFNTNDVVGTFDLAFSPVVNVLINFTQATVTGDPFLTSMAAMHFQLLDADTLHCSESLLETALSPPSRNATNITWRSGQSAFECLVAFMIVMLLDGGYSL